MKGNAWRGAIKLKGSGKELGRKTIMDADETTAVSKGSVGAREGVSIIGWCGRLVVNKHAATAYTSMMPRLM